MHALIGQLRRTITRLRGGSSKLLVMSGHIFCPQKHVNFFQEC